SPRDAKANYALGVAYGFRANAGFLIRKAYMDALRDATQSRKLCNLVTEIEPENVDAKLVQGLHDYVVGSLPFYMKFVGFLAGFRGDKDKGIATVRMVSERGTLNKLDAQILLGVIYRRERRAGDAIGLLTPLIQRFPRNYLFRLELAQMYSDLGEKAKTLETFDEIERLKKAGTKGYERLSWERLAFARGNMLFWYQDFDVAIEQLKTATAHPESLDLNNGTMAWMRLGQCYDMKKQRAAAKTAYRAAIQMAPASEVAKESRRYLDAPYVRRD
ncbi:MAG: tetratricopeptide repeat protein, partial [Bryobacteraceae bacterium]|nr:tetratricopeptide repeat protein [Bryobacteraceae bacterium]